MEALLQAAPFLTHAVGRHEDLTCGQRTCELVVSHGCQTHGRNAATLRAIGIAAELAGCDLRLQVCGECFRSAGEDAFFRAAGWRSEFADDGFRHIKDRILEPEVEQVTDDA